MTMSRTLFAITLAASLGACALDRSAPLTFRPEQRPSQALLEAPPPYAARARSQERDLEAKLLPIIARAKARAAAIRQGLDDALAALPVPQRYATREPQLRRFHEPNMRAYREAVSGLYASAIERLDQQLQESVAQGEALAKKLAGARSPLDGGASGDPLLDRQLRSFADTLRMTLDRERLQAVGYQRAGHRVDKLEVFSTFTSEGADEALGGRLMLFVGAADDKAGLPLCDVVLRTDPGVAPQDRGVFQAVRYRVMAGTTIVEDQGWSPFPNASGLPPVHLWADRFLIAPDLAPRLRTDVSSFDQLRSFRVLADVQTTVFDRSRKVLGGVDWRLEFRVSDRGELTWLPSAVRPEFNPTCAESLALMRELGQLPESENQP